MLEPASQNQETAGVPVQTQSTPEQPNNTEPFGIGPEQIPPLDAFAAPVEPDPAASAEPQQPDGLVEPKNDQKRFEYWQSQADQKEQRLKEFESISPLVDYIKQNPQIMLQAEQGVAGAQGQGAQLAPKEFPPPPPPPQRPANYSQEDALSDPESNSAKYLQAQEEHQEKMNKYNYLQNAYTQKLVQDMQTAQQETQVQQEQRQEQLQQIQSVRDYMTGHHQADPQVADRFIQWASDDGSLTVDNLWQLFQLQQGGPMTQPGVQHNTMQQPGTVGQQIPAPSQQFQQTQRAQQVPTPMGVQPAAGQDMRTPEDQVMDGMIANYKNSNPW